MKIGILKILGLFLLFSVSSSYSQLRKTPKKIKFEEEFVHSKTETTFPKNIEDFPLSEAYCFDKKNENIGVTYEKGNTKLNIYFYPSKIANEGRLRNEFLNTQSDVDHKDVKIIRHKGEKYTCNGIRRISKNANNENSLVTIFECGTWMYKIGITSSELNDEGLLDLETKTIQKVEPSRLTGLKLLDLRGSIVFSSTAIKDSTMLVSTMAYTFKKCEWLLKNIDENERYSGFQDLYIDMHKEALKAFVLFEHKHKYSSSGETKEYLKNLNNIIDSPYLNEFLMEEYKMLLIVPENIKLNFEDYHKWKTENNFGFELKNNLSLVKYET